MITPKTAGWEWLRSRKHQYLMRRITIITIIILSVTACSRFNNGGKNTELLLTKKSDSLYFLEIKTDTSHNQWELPYPVYRYQTGDIDQDGIEDMMVGVIKTTRFDPTISKRIFIFKNSNGLVRPLWLGSRLGQPLEDFIFVSHQNKAFIRSIEKEHSGKYLVAEYKWKRFGLEFCRYICREVELSKAQEIIRN